MQEALDRLFSRRRFGMKPGLEVELDLLGRLGNPHEELACVHVAGTNGKGSVCALLEAMLKDLGLRVGMFTSPHLVRFNERYRVAGECIGDDELLDLIGEVEAAASETGKALGKEPTFFECSAAIAFLYFRNVGVHVAILETGMGGRLDATNVVLPLLSVITRISRDHAMYLGDDLPSIAAEKCGIIKKGRPVVCGAMDASALEVARRTASARGCALVEAEQSVSVTVRGGGLAGQDVEVETANARYGRVRLPLLGVHQVENLATAVAALESVCDVLGVAAGPDSVKRGAAAVDWPGRCQVIRQSPPVIIDGAHNAGAAEALVRTLDRLMGSTPLGLVVGMCNDKEMAEFLAPFGPLVRRCWAVPIANERSASPEELSAEMRRLGCESTVAALRAALAEAVRWAEAGGGAVCVTGSLYLVGEVLAEQGGTA